MIVAVVAAALWRPGPILPLAVAIAALRHPIPAALTLAVWLLVTRLRGSHGPTPDDEARILDRLVGELEGGSSPRAAVVAVSGSGAIDLSESARLVEAGMPIVEVAESIGRALPHNGRLASAAVAVTGSTGAAAAPVMRLLARRASERGRLERERRALTAQSRATAWLIAGLPLGVLSVLLVSGRLRPGPALPVIGIGVALQLAGLVAVVAMLRRSW